MTHHLLCSHCSKKFLWLKATLCPRVDRIYGNFLVRRIWRYDFDGLAHLGGQKLEQMSSCTGTEHHYPRCGRVRSDATTLLFECVGDKLSCCVCRSIVCAVEAKSPQDRPQVDPVRPFSRGVHAPAFNRPTSVTEEGATDAAQGVAAIVLTWALSYLGIDRIVEETFQRMTHCVICRGACILQLFGHVFIATVYVNPKTVI